MGIVLGYLCLLCLCGLLGKALTRRIVKADGMRVHRYLSGALAVLCPLHLLMVWPVLDTRSIWVLLSGAGVAALFIGLVVDGHGRLRWHRGLSVAVAVCALAHVWSYCDDFVAYREHIRQITLQPVAFSRLADGVYTGESDAGYIYAKVQVTVSDGAVQGVELLEHRHERGQAAEQLTDTILRRQTFPVDAVAGATNSSKVIQQAVQNALAGG